MQAIKRFTYNVTIYYKNGTQKTHTEKRNYITTSNELDYIKDILISIWTYDVSEIQYWFSFEYIDGIKNIYLVTSDDGIKFSFCFNNGEREWEEVFKKDEGTFNKVENNFNFNDFIYNINKRNNSEEFLLNIVEEIMNNLFSNKFDNIIHNNRIIGVKIEICRHDMPSDLDKLKEIICKKIKGVNTVEIEKRNNNTIFISLY